MKNVGYHLMLIIACIFLFLCASAYAETYTLDEALSLVGSGAGDRLELSEDIEEINPFTEGQFQSAGGKSIILWREGPEKEFEICFEPLSEEYEGKDIGEGHVYLCADLMEQIPAELRAKTKDEIENVLIAETRYLVSGVITSNIGKRNSELPSVAEIEHMIQTGESSDVNSLEDVEDKSSLSYKPVFNCAEMCYLYNLPTQSSVIFDYEAFKVEELRRNPEAADLWSHLMEIGILMQSEMGEDMNKLQGIFQEGSYAEFLSEKDYQALAARISSRDYPGTLALCEDIFWDMAKALGDLDYPASGLYDKAVLARSYEVLNYIVNIRAYSAVEMDDVEIELSKAYLGKPDLNRLSAMLQDSLDLINYAEWNMELFSAAVNSAG